MLGTDFRLLARIKAGCVKAGRPVSTPSDGIESGRISNLSVAHTYMHVHVHACTLCVLVPLLATLHVPDLYTGCTQNCVCES